MNCLKFYKIKTSKTKRIEINFHKILVPFTTWLRLISYFFEENF